MRDPIREDVSQQVMRLLDVLRETFDPDAYPRVADGAAFDRQLLRAEWTFGELKRTFHDYLLASWAAEVNERLGSGEPRG